MTKQLISLAFAAALLPLAMTGAASAQQNCQKVGAGPVALTGMVASLQASGPPGYGQSPKTDSVVQVPIMQLNPPLCVTGVGGDPAQQNLNSVQLVFQPGGPQFQTEMTGTSFMASGTLSPAQGPDQMTPVVLVVQSIEQVMAPVDQSGEQQPMRQSPGAMPPQPPNMGPPPGQDMN